MVQFILSNKLNWLLHSAIRDKYNPSEKDGQQMDSYEVHNHRLIFSKMKSNEEQIITGYPIDGAMASSGRGLGRKFSMVCLHNNAIVARGILVSILHCGTPALCLSAIYIVSSVGTSLLLKPICIVFSFRR